MELIDKLRVEIGVSDQIVETTVNFDSRVVDGCDLD
jgi:hypothetical protein